MAHLQIQYSKNLDEHADIAKFCNALAREIALIGIYPLGGIRVRAFAAEHFAIADLHSQNAFIDMLFRIGQGRSYADKKATGGRLMKLAETYFAKELASGFFMLSLEIIEIDSTQSWKTNSVHQRLKKEGANAT